jgi:hypothetical protein
MKINKWQYGYMREQVILQLTKRYGKIFYNTSKEIFFKNEDSQEVSKIPKKWVRETALELCEEILNNENTK